MKAYRFLAFMIAVLVVVQAGAIAWALLRDDQLGHDDGGVVNKELLECERLRAWSSPRSGASRSTCSSSGFVLIPLTSLVLLIVSFFAKVPRGVTLAAVIFGLVVLQVFVLPALSREVGSGFGALHGVNASGPDGHRDHGRAAGVRSHQARSAESATAATTPATT